MTLKDSLKAREYNPYWRVVRPLFLWLAAIMEERAASLVQIVGMFFHGLQLHRGHASDRSNFFSIYG